MEPAAAPPSPAAPPSETDWGAFVDSYGRVAVEWLRAQGLPGAEADALARSLFQIIAREFKDIVNAPTLRFRAWLHFAVHKAWSRLTDGQADGLAPEASSASQAMLNSVDMYDAFIAVLDEECTHQRRRE